MVEGESFVPGVQAVVNGTSRVATYINPTTLEVDLTASDISAAGTLDIGAINPAPGGGPSVNELPFVVTAPSDNPVPSISSLVPPGTEAGASTDLMLTVHGNNFIASSQAQWNGQDLATTYVGQSELLVTVPASALSSAGTAVVTVSNPAPGGGSSNPVGFTITLPWYNPVPAIEALSPAETTVYGFVGEVMTIQIHGSSFIEETQAQWNGEDRATEYVDETEVAITLTAVDTTPAGTGSITVENPTPGGGTSNAVSFTLRRVKYVTYLPITMR
jgi:hypothetical protein